MKKSVVLLITLMIIGVGFLSGCEEQTSTDNLDDSYVPATPKNYVVTYRVTGMAESVSITYVDHKGKRGRYSKGTGAGC